MRLRKTADRSGTRYELLLCCPCKAGEQLHYAMFVHGELPRDWIAADLRLARRMMREEMTRHEAEAMTHPRPNDTTPLSRRR